MVKMALNNFKIFNFFLGIVLAFFLNFSAYTQTDTPCGAPNLSVGIASCTYTLGVSASTDSLQYNAANGGVPSCGWLSNLNLYGNPDVWYSFTAPAGGTVHIQTQTTGSSYLTNGAMAVYSGVCTNLTEIGCDQNGNGMPGLILNNLVAGNTYYIRFWGRHAASAPPYAFNICLFAPLPPPPNDSCINAISTPVNPDAYCNLFASGTVQGATASSQSGCFIGPSAVDDVWFSFVATNTTHYINFNNVVGPALSYSIHSGTCASMTLLTCNNLSNNLVVGNMYYVRVYTGSITSGTSFNLCITTPPPMPSCATNPSAGNTTCTATPICNLDGYCGSTSASYTPNHWPGLLSPFCGTIENNSFLSFVAEDTTISFFVWVMNSTNASGIQIMVFSAASCNSGSVTSYSCWSPGNVSVAPVLISVPGLTIGNTYYIMIDGNAGDVADYVIGAHEGIGVSVEVATVPGDTNICFGQSIDLFATGGSGSYTWSPSIGLNNTISDTVTFTPSSTGSYTYQAYSPNSNPLCPSDSASLILVVNTPDTIFDVQSWCGSYTWIDGVTYTANNDTATFTALAGSIYSCDTVIILDLTITTTYDSTDTQVACGSYTWLDGITYNLNNDSATFTLPGSGANICDTNLTLDLTIVSSSTSTDTITSCNSYLWIDGITYTSNNTSATYIITGGSQNGCDSIITLNLTIINPATSIDTVVACNSYTWMNGNTYTSNNNMATHTITGGSQNGCDSIITLHLTINNPTTSTDSIVACNSYTWLDGINYTSNNNTVTHTIIGGSQYGCDSIITLNLTINTPANGTDTVVSCNSYTWLDGNTYTSNNTSATYTIPSAAQNGCDSIVTLNLTITSPTTGIDNVTACNSYTWIDGVTYTTNNNTSTYTIFGGAQNGCDSIVTLQLIINNLVQGIDMVFACNSFTWIDGNTYTSNNNSATFTIPNGSSAGCDSTVTLNLTIGTAIYSTATVTACESFTWINGITYTNSINMVSDTLPGGSQSGCDSIVTLDLTIVHPTIGIDTVEACDSYTWIDGITYTYSNSAATHTIDGGAANGCDSIVNLDLSIFNILEPDIEDLSLLCNEPVELVLTENYATYLWSDGSTTPSITVNSEGVYSVTVTDINNCTGFDEANIIDDCPVSIWIPNAFTPNSDANNQTFRPVISGEIRNYSLTIFNRWGQELFLSNNVEIGWDGKFKGEYVLNEVYTYRIFFNPKQGREVELHIGSVTLLR
jgi:gliding motility-associated-like protein